MYEFSAYKFENEMGRIRGMVRSKNRKLEQMYNRCMENMIFDKKCTYSRGNEFKIVADDRDSYFSLKDGSIVRVEEVKKDCTLGIRFLRKMEKELFDHPQPSSSIGVHFCKLSTDLGEITSDSLDSKLYRINLIDEDKGGDDEDNEEDIDLDVERREMNLNTEFVVVPLLHHP